MKFVETKLKGAFIIELEKREDARGFFARTFCEKEFTDRGLEGRVAQGNTSYNFKKGTLRGMHRQLAPHQEAKIIRCVRGAIWDVIIDLRKDSATYKQWIGVELSQENYKTLYVPRDFGHGYLTLTDHAELTYLVTGFYHPGSEAGIRWNDPAFKIDWPKDVVITEMTEKDKNFPDFKD